MPHVGAGSGGDDLASSDEIKVFKDEGDEDENRSSENLTDLKSSLVTEGEEEKSSEVPCTNDYGSPKNPDICRPDSASLTGKNFELLSPHSGPIGYVVSPYPHPHNGSLGSVSMSGKVPPPHPGSPLPFMVYNGEAFAQPPPAHMGIPPVAIDPKTGIPRPPVYHLGPPGQYPPVFSPEFTHQLQWGYHLSTLSGMLFQEDAFPVLNSIERHTPALYPPSTVGFRSAYSSALPVTSSSLPRFSPPTLLSPYPGITSHPGISHPALITAAGHKQELHHSTHRSLQEYPSEQKYSSVKPSVATSAVSQAQAAADAKKTHIKKPLNAFMLYMKEMRAKVVAECTLKESAAINQILGRRWHSLSRDEQAKYYEMARKERQLHMQLYPGWSARDNYALQVKKKKRKRDRNQDGDGNNLKKCRARFGLDRQSNWCKPCRRKKKCIRYSEGPDSGQLESEDNMGSAGSVEAPTPDSNKTDDSDDHPSPPLTPLSSVDTKPRMDVTSPATHHQYHLGPLSVHHLIQPHINPPSTRNSSTLIRTDGMSRFPLGGPSSAGTSQTMLTVT